MKIEIVTIGDELLKGRVVNTNAAFISAHLQQQGYPLLRQTTLSDRSDLLEEGLKEALARSEVVIATGGLGPTLDDRTREIAATLFNCGFRTDHELAAELKSRFKDRYSAVEDQARVPEKALLLPNRVGSAPGLLFSEKGKTLILMPGVPKEMEPMFVEQVLPRMQEKWQIREKKRSVQLCFCLVYESLLDPHLRELESRYPSVEVGIYPAHGTLCVSLLSSNAAELRSFEQELRRRFGDYIYETTTGKIAESLQNWFVKHKKTLAFAESCTGGLMASLITALSGASDYFLGSFVVYSNAMKEKVLGVSPQTLLSLGAVSEEAAREMLQGVFERSNADFAIAITGIAGPTGELPDKPVGTMCAAIGQRGKTPDVGRFTTYGSRETIILVTANYLLGALWRKVEKEIPAFPLLKVK